MLMFDETTGQYFDTDKVDAIIAAFLLAYMPNRKNAILAAAAEALGELFPREN